MSIEVWMTGKEDAGDWQIAVGGYPGSGKTMFASTAPNPFYIFFGDNPRLKSVADRHVSHVKLGNRFDEEGSLVDPVWDQMFAVREELRAGKINCETVVIDTADELFLAMKQGRRASKGGEWAISDWDWIADLFQEIVTSFVNLPFKVIVLFHVKRDTTDLDGEMSDMFEPALQGRAKEEFAGWFDVVGVIRSHYKNVSEGEEEDGVEVQPLDRHILFSATRQYPWVKDHSGRLPERFTVSEDFVGDYSRLVESFGVPGTNSSRELLHTVEQPERPETKTGMPVPTPQQVVDKKKGKGKSAGGPATVTSVEPVKEDDELEAAARLVAAEFSVSDVTDGCAECGAEVNRQHLRDMTLERFGKVLCTACYKKEIA